MDRKKIAANTFVFIIYALFLLLLYPFFKSILFAVLFAFALHDPAKKLMGYAIGYKNKRFKLSYFTSVTVLLVGLMASIVVPFILVCAHIINSFKELDKDGGIMHHPLVQKAIEMGNNFHETVKASAATFGVNINQELDLKASVGEYMKNIAAYITTFVANIPEYIFDFTVFVVMIYFFLSKRHQIKAMLYKAQLFEEDQIKQVLVIMRNICSTVLLSTIIIAGIQSLIITAAAAFAGYDESLLIFIVGFFLAFMPLLGTMPLSAVLLIHSIINGDYKATVIIFIAAVVAGVIDNIIRSVIFSSGESEINPIISLLTLLGALAIFGISGLFLGPIIAELAYKLHESFLKNKGVLVNNLPPSE